MPFFIIKGEEGYYYGQGEDGRPRFRQELTSDVFVCGTNMAEAQREYSRLCSGDLRDVLTEVERRNSLPLPPEQPAAAPKDGEWKVIDNFGKIIALLFNGKVFAIRRGNAESGDVEVYDDGIKAWTDWSRMREQVGLVRIRRLVGA